MVTNYYCSLWTQCFPPCAHHHRSSTQTPAKYPVLGPGRLSSRWNFKILFACISLPHPSRRKLNTSTLPILNRTAGYTSTTAHFPDILAPIVAHYGPSEPRRPIFTSDFVHRCRYSAVAQFGPAEKGSLAKLGKLRQLCWGLSGLRAMDLLIGRSCMQNRRTLK